MNELDPWIPIAIETGEGGGAWRELWAKSPPGLAVTASLG